MANRVKPSMGCAWFLVLLFLGIGLTLLTKAATQYENLGRVFTKDVLVKGIAGAVAVLGSGVYLRFARKLVRASEAEEARRAQHPDQPWMWKKEWAGGVIEADGRSSALLFWFFTVFWNAIAWPAVWAMLTKPHQEKAAWMILAFPLIGLGLLAGAIYQTIQARKFGRPRFLLSRMPGAIGGYVGGMIEVPARVTPEADVKLVLRCLQNEMRGTGKNRHVQEVVLWEHEERIPPEKLVSGPGRTEIPVLFYVPDTCGPTDDSVRNQEVFWRLNATAAAPGVDFAARFVVPVFRTGETAAPPEPDKPLLDDYRAGPPNPQMLREAGVRREEGAYYFDAAQLWLSRLVFTLVALAFVVLWTVLRVNHVPVPWIVWVVTGMFGAIFIFAALDLWFAKFELHLEPDTVLVRKPRPWGTKETRVSRAEVAGIGTARSMSVGTTQYYRLELNGTEGPAAGGANKPFLARKLEYQMRQAAARGAGLADAEMAALREQLRHQPKFCVPFAKHVPGEEMAKKIGAMILADIRGGK